MSVVPRPIDCAGFVEPTGLEEVWGLESVWGVGGQGAALAECEPVGRREARGQTHQREVGVGWIVNDPVIPPPAKIRKEATRGPGWKGHVLAGGNMGLRPGSQVIEESGPASCCGITLWHSSA